MLRSRIIGLCALWLALTACDGSTFQSSVPRYPVHVVIDVERLFVDFTPENLYAHIIATSEGFFKNGVYVTPALATDAWGYAGVLAYVSMNGYDAYDLACPNCAKHGKKVPCYIDGMFAVCPECGEQYDLAGGYAIPQKGLSKETLLRLNIIRSGKKLTITQRQ